jgi:hypothetical protein
MLMMNRLQFLMPPAIASLNVTEFSALGTTDFTIPTRSVFVSLRFPWA